MAKLKPWYQVVTPREDLRDTGSSGRTFKSVLIFAAAKTGETKSALRELGLDDKVSS